MSNSIKDSIPLSYLSPKSRDVSPWSLNLKARKLKYIRVIIVGTRVVVFFCLDSFLR